MVVVMMMMMMIMTMCGGRADEGMNSENNGLGLGLRSLLLFRRRTFPSFLRVEMRDGSEQASRLLVL